LLDLVVVERINASGAVISQGSQDGSVTLPVTTEDRLIAADSGAPWLRTEDVDGVPFRIITVPSPGGGAVLLARDLDETNQVLASLRVWFGLLDLSVIVLAAAAGWLIARRIAAPLLHLTATAEDVATKGVFQGSVESSRRDEVGRLARAFAAMLTVLDRSRQQQHQLVRDAGHELRTPLTSIRSNVDLLHRYPDLPAATRENLLGDLESELRELTTLVDEIVELATDSHGAEADTAVHIEELTARAAHRVEKRSGRHITLAGAPWVVVGREKALERAVSNLLDNAVKFSPDGSPIEVTLRPGHLEVRDYGPGIPDADLPAVFQRFYRANSARSKPGSGLGLSIVRQVVEDHGGTVFAQNAPGGGAVIGFDLPLLHP
jgi:two-component system sensor histidine kinase MprB